MIEIPFRYQLHKDFIVYPHFGLSTIVDGIKICHNLGLEVISMKVGQDEWEQLIKMTYNGEKEENRIINTKKFPFIIAPKQINIITSNLESELVFICE
jgi:hypothetical protein